MTIQGEQYPFSARDPALGTSGLYPFLPISLSLGQRTVAVQGLLDTAASVNVIPYEIGLQIGAAWDARAPSLELTGNLAREESRALMVTAKVGQFPPVVLAFAWARNNSVPVLLGQTNFFMEFDVCFFRSKAVFEVRPRQT
jgi:hypothetical protein